MLGVLHAQEMQDHLIDDLYMSICLMLEGNGFGHLGFQQRPETQPEGAQESFVPI
jgi:hypothetical protein